MSIVISKRLVKKVLASLLTITACSLGPLAHAQLVAAVLPSSRSAEVGNTVTVFATIINGGGEAATGCGIGAPAGFAGNFSFQTTDPGTNAPSGTANALIDLAPGAAQSFVLSLTPTAILDSLDAAFSFSCTSGASAQSISGVNTLLLSASDTPVVDIIALAATAANTGVLDIDNSTGAFSLATVNLGTADTITVSADTGDIDLPVALSLCETNPATGACLASPSEALQVEVAAGAMPTFSVFSNATDRIVNDPAINRVFIRFLDSNGIVRGGTSVGIENEFDLGNSLTQGTFSVLDSALANFESTDSDTIEGTVDCATSGRITFTATIDNISEESSVTTQTTVFENCDGLNGQIDSVSTADFGAESFSINQIQNGSVSSPECEEVTYTDFQLTASINFEESEEDTFDAGMFALTGEISGVCEGIAFSCELDTLSEDIEAELGDSCSF